MRLKKHNPALLSSVELVKQFVVRKNDLDILIKTIRENTDRKANQHIMFIGSRGMGKTTLVMRAVVELHNIKTLNDNWFPVVMAEESYVVGNAGEFWLEAILRLAESLGDNELNNIHNKLLDEIDNKVLYEKALKTLLDFADKQGKRLIIFAENLNMLFDDKQLNENDGWLLRETLINEPRIMMVATATSRFDQIDNIQQAMFELFAVRELKALSLNECKNIWNMVTKSEVSERRIRPIEILTGGNPRLLVILSAFAANNSFKRLIEDLVALIDDHTDYLKSNTENLPPLERKVFVSLADIWEPATAKDIAKLTRLNVNSASTQLTRLVKRGAVVVQRVEGRKKYYQLAERLYNIYHQMRRRGGQSDRVKTAVKFMISYYEEDTLCHMVNSISKECVQLTEDERCDHFKVLEGLIIESKDPRIKKRLIHSIEPEMFNFYDKTPKLRLFREEMYDEKRNLIEQKKRHFSNPINKKKLDFIQKDASSVTLLAKFIKRKPGIIEKALLNIKNGVNSKLKNDYLIEFAKIYFNTNNDKKLKLDQLNENDSKCIYEELIKLGNEFEDNNQFKEANETLKNATKLEPMIGKAWNIFGRILTKQKQLPKAEKCYKKAIELEPENAETCRTYAMFLSNQRKKYDEAEKYYKKSLELKPDNAENFRTYAIFLSHERNDYNKAEDYYKKALELEPSNVMCYWTYAHFLSYRRNDYDKTEEYSKKAIGLERKEYDKAEEYYKKAIDLEPENLNIFAEYCLCLIHQKKYKVAQKICKDKFIFNTKIDNCEYNIGYLFFSLGWFDYSIQVFENILTNDPDDGDLYINIGYISLITGFFEKAKTSFEKASEFLPEGGRNIFTTANLGLVLCKAGQIDEALQHLNKAMADISADNVGASEFNAIVCLCLQLNLTDYYPNAEQWINLARESNPGRSDYAHTHACILAELGKWDKAIEAIREFMENDKFASNFVSDITAFFIKAAKAGHAKKSLEILNNSPSSKYLEPLIVALQKHLGQQTNAPLEVYEVAKDIVAEIIKES